MPRALVLCLLGHGGVKHSRPNRALPLIEPQLRRNQPVMTMARRMHKAHQRVLSGRLAASGLAHCRHSALCWKKRHDARTPHPFPETMKRLRMTGGATNAAQPDWAAVTDIQRLIRYVERWLLASFQRPNDATDLRTTNAEEVLQRLRIGLQSAMQGGYATQLHTGAAYLY